jgi:isopentenyl-diphosphate delta-isomerase
MDEQLILVNENDDIVGFDEKLKVHREGTLHRAFSIFIFNFSGELLLQRRALGKYHSPGLWSNTCCGHPRAGQEIVSAAQERLEQEMGLRCPLEEVGRFIYRADVGNDLIEHELDHLLIGYCDLDPILNLKEATEWRRTDHAALRMEIDTYPENFTCWLRVIIQGELINSEHIGRATAK